MRYEGKKDEMKWRALGVKKKHPRIVRVQNYDISWKINYPESCEDYGHVHDTNIKSNGSQNDVVQELLKCMFIRHSIEIYNEHHNTRVSVEDVEILGIKKNEFLEL